MTDKITHRLHLSEDDYGMRLDQALAKALPEYSRSKIQTWIKSGQITVNEKSANIRDKVKGGEQVKLEAERAPLGEAMPAPVDYEVVYEDETIIVANKPAGLVVHPAAGHSIDTLMNGLLYDYPQLQSVPRAGIVHRLDKDTTGLMVVAKTIEAQTNLVSQLQARTVHREYVALVYGQIIAGGTIDAPIGRHPTDRKKQAVLQGESGKEAITHYRVLERYPHHTLVQCKLETGRTHQIRVHMAHIKHPLVGDVTYGGRVKLPPNPSDEITQALRNFQRQALHAVRLGLVHPESRQEMVWENNLPDDFYALLEVITADAVHQEAGYGY